MAFGFLKKIFAALGGKKPAQAKGDGGKNGGKRHSPVIYEKRYSDDSG